MYVGVRNSASDIITTKPKYANDVVVQAMKRIEHFKKEQDEGEYMPYKAACDRDGKDIIDEGLAHNTIESRRNRKLPTSTKIRYPENQEVRYVKETFAHGKVTDKMEVTPLPHGQKKLVLFFGSSVVYSLSFTMAWGTCLAVLIDNWASGSHNAQMLFAAA